MRDQEPQLKRESNSFDVSEQFINNLNHERELRGDSEWRYRMAAKLNQSPARSAFTASFGTGLALLGIGLASYLMLGRTPKKHSKKKSNSAKNRQRQSKQSKGWF